MFGRRKVGETELVEFYKDWNTDHIDKELKSVDKRGVSLSDHRCLHAVGKKDDIDEYVLFDGKGKPIMAASTAYDLEVKITLYRMVVHANLDIVRIAETGEVPRVV